MEIADAALEIMINYDWPGNVRELRNLMEHLVLLRDGSPITADDLKDHFNVQVPEDGVTLPLGLPLAEIEKKYILKTLETMKGNRTRTAEALGIGRRTLIRKLAEYGVNSAEDG